MHALIIEDEAFVACAIEDTLRDEGYNSFDFACSCDEAVEAAQARQPDLITSDMRLFRSSGTDAVEKIRCAMSVPVVFVTAIAAEVRKRLPNAVIVQKPFRPRDLANAVANARGD